MRRGTTRLPHKDRHRPTRTCIGCGRKGFKDELLRFVAVDDALIYDPGAQGRAAYTCRRLSCFERAASRNAFNRTLRQRVRVEPGLAALYT
jgi:uncharacterized protein